jgi:hypothetical protein
MGMEYRKRCLEYALQQCRQDAIVNMTDDEIIAEWGLQRSPAGPLHAAAPRIEALEAKNGKLREALSDLVSWFTTPNVSGRVWIIPAGEHGADGAVTQARDTLEALSKDAA